jgi:hypothetical protein
MTSATLQDVSTTIPPTPPALPDPLKWTCIDATKCVVDCGSTPLTVMLYLNLLATWAYTRLYVFPTLVIEFMYPPGGTPSVAACVLQLVLLLLHVYWFTLFLRMGYNLLLTKTAEDIQERCTENTADMPKVKKG